MSKRFWVLVNVPKHERRIEGILHKVSNHSQFIEVNSNRIISSKRIDQNGFMY